jgi:protein phosphatase
MVRERDVESIARTEPDPQRAAEALVKAANDAGGEDNITVVVVDVVEADDNDAATAVVPASTAAAAAATTSPEPEAAPEPKTPREPGSRMRTVRGVILVVLPLVLILGAATAALGWYARRSYYVGVDQNEVVIYKGVPGGVLGWDPTIDARTGIKVSSLPQVDADRVQTNSTRGSLETARDYVAQLNQQTTTSTTTTPTTKPKKTTTTTVKRRATTTTAPRP